MLPEGLQVLISRWKFVLFVSSGQMMADAFLYLVEIVA